MRKRISKWLRRIACRIWSPEPFYSPPQPKFCTFKGGPIDGQRLPMEYTAAYALVPTYTKYGNVENVKYTYMQYTHYFDGRPEEWVAELYPTFTSADTLRI